MTRCSTGTKSHTTDSSAPTVDAFDMELIKLLWYSWNLESLNAAKSDGIKVGSITGGTTTSESEVVGRASNAHMCTRYKSLIAGLKVWLYRLNFYLQLLLAEMLTLTHVVILLCRNCGSLESNRPRNKWEERVRELSLTVFAGVASYLFLPDKLSFTFAQLRS